MDGFKFEVLRRVNKTKNGARYSEIAGMWKSGVVMEDIAKRYGVSRQRIQQILKNQNLEREDGGQAIDKFKRAHEIVAKQKEREKAKEIRCQAKWGMSLIEYREHVDKWGNTAKIGSPMHRFMIQRKTAIHTRKIGWELSFADWWRFWQESGKWDERGRGKGYGMSRYGDTGPYAKGNIYICTIGQNFSDSYLAHSAKSRTFKKGPGKKGYYRRGNRFYVIVGRKYGGSFKTAKEARMAYEAKWAEEYAR